MGPQTHRSSHVIGFSWFLSLPLSLPRIPASLSLSPATGFGLSSPPERKLPGAEGSPLDCWVWVLVRRTGPGWPAIVSFPSTQATAHSSHQMRSKCPFLSAQTTCTARSRRHCPSCTPSPFACGCAPAPRQASARRSPMLCLGKPMRLC